MIRCVESSVALSTAAPRNNTLSRARHQHIPSGALVHQGLLAWASGQLEPQFGEVCRVSPAAVGTVLMNGMATSDIAPGLTVAAAPEPDVP